MANGHVILPVPRLSQNFDTSRWREQCFEFREAAEYWSHRACGIACVGMLIAYFGGQGPSLAALLHEGLRQEAYSARGWIHAGLARLLGEHGVPSGTSLLGYPNELAAAISDGVPVIASVADEFPLDGRRGGHLVVVKGVTIEKGRVVTIHFNDPSSWGSQHSFVEVERFWASFTGQTVRPYFSVHFEQKRSRLSL